MYYEDMKLESKVWCCDRNSLAESYKELNQVLVDGTWFIVDTQVVGETFYAHMQRHSKPSQVQKLERTR